MLENAVPWTVLPATTADGSTTCERVLCSAGARRVCSCPHSGRLLGCRLSVGTGTRRVVYRQLFAQG